MRTRYLLMLVILLVIPTADLFGKSPKSDEAAAKPTQSDVSVDEIVDQWIAASQAIHQVDISGRLIQYDLDFEVVRHSRFRYVTQGSHRVFGELLPFEGDISKSNSRRKKRDGNPFDARSSQHEVVLADESSVLQLDPISQEGLRYVPIPPAVIAERQQKGFWNRSAIRVMGPFLNRPFIHGLHSPSIAEFCHGMKWSLQRQDNREIILTGTPTTERFVALFAKVDVKLDPHTHLADALRLTDTSCSRESVYVIEERVINGCPESVDHLFRYDLDCFTIVDLAVSESPAGPVGPQNVALSQHVVEPDDCWLEDTEDFNRSEWE